MKAYTVDVAHAIPEYCSWSQTYTNMVQSVIADTQTEERARFVAKETELACIEARLENAEKRLQELPKYTNCTEFIEWLTEVVLNDEDWKLNAVGYGEIICRKLEKLGVLEVTEEPSYYIRPSADAKQGEWIEKYNGNGWNDFWDYTCSHCGKKYERADAVLCHANYCPNCGARMTKGGAEE